MNWRPIEERPKVHGQWVLFWDQSQSSDAMACFWREHISRWENQKAYYGDDYIADQFTHFCTIDPPEEE